MTERFRKMAPYTCLWCGKDFIARADRPASYCSMTCKGLAKRRSPEERFWEKVKKTGNGPDDCWFWTAAKDPVTNVGHFAVKKGDVMTAYKWSWEQVNGPVPTGMQLNHTCHHGDCVRPEHLYLGTQRQNVEDMVEANRAAWQRPNGYPNGRRFGSNPGSLNASAKLDERKVQVMRWLYWNLGLSPKELARWFGLNDPNSVWGIVRGQSWKHVTDLFTGSEFHPPVDS